VERIESLNPTTRGPRALFLYTFFVRCPRCFSLYATCRDFLVLLIYSAVAFYARMRSSWPLTIQDNFEICVILVDLGGGEFVLFRLCVHSETLLIFFTSHYFKFVWSEKALIGLFSYRKTLVTAILDWKDGLFYFLWIQIKNRALSPRANCTDRATASCRRNALKIMEIF
jgi:hypothetical protein